MDHRLHLLLHTLSGFRPCAEDLVAISQGQGWAPRELVGALTSLAARAYFQGRRDWFTDSERTLELGQSAGVRWAHCFSEEYPAGWRELSKGPLVFSYLGDPVWLRTDLLSVVGSRTPRTETRMWMQRELGEFLRLHKVGIVSGGARGVDQWAHRLAVDYERPTICVFPSGLLNRYPFDQDELWRRILEGGGCLLSTFGLEEPMRKHAFHVRNRWIAGLAKVCFVVEANRRSGSWLTAKLANEEQRDVCTLPTFPLSAQGLANLDLIADGGAFMIRDCGDLTRFCEANWRRPTYLKQEEFRLRPTVF